MFKNLNEQDKKKMTYLLSLGAICIIALIVLNPLTNNEEGVEDVSTTNSQEEAIQKEVQGLEAELEEILGQIQGAGEVDVLITYESSEALEPAYNTNSTTETTEETDSQGGERTVTTSSENKTMISGSTSEPVVIKTIEPKIRGVLVVSSGANDPVVKETLYSAVQTALQVSGHQVEIHPK